MICINQVGYRPQDGKYAIAPATLSGKAFHVCSDLSGETLFSGVFGSPMYDAGTDTNVCTGDFSHVTKAGVCHVECENEKSYSFAIDAHVYDSLYVDIFRMLYLQRCGVQLPEKLAGDFHHIACHNTPARIWLTDRFKNVDGGWHDAGDYGRYVVPGAKVIADLLLLWRLCGNRALICSQQMNIPESGNGVPDILNEARFQLEWMLRMQDEESGGVYHKVSCRTFPPFVMPQEEQQQLVLAPISDAATADFCAVMYMAAVDYAPYDAVFAETCHEAADRAWSCLMALDHLTGYTNPDGIRTGSYADAHVEDEVFFAAAERLRWQKKKGSELDPEALCILNQSIAGKPYPGLGWADMSGYALFEAADTFDRTDAFAILKQAADRVIEMQAKDGYGSSLGTRYPWGSSMNIANHGMLLLLCDHIYPEPIKRIAAHRLLDVLLGENGLNFCFVSGHGTDSLKYPHHRPSVWLRKAMPGMLSGGPNMHTQDECARNAVAGKPSALCYIDDTRSYSTNEIAIYWNSPLIFLVGAL